MSERAHTMLMETLATKEDLEQIALPKFYDEKM